MSRSLIIAGVFGICLGAASPVIYRTVTTRSSAEPSAIATASTSSEGSGGKYEVATAATPTLPSTAPAAEETSPQATAPATAPTQDQAYEEAVREVAAENTKLKANRDAYYDHTAEVRKESDEHYRQLQQQGNIRAQENLAAAKLQEQKDEAAEAEYNPGAYWNSWSAGDWNHVNRWSNGYLWRP